MRKYTVSDSTYRLLHNFTDRLMVQEPNLDGSYTIEVEDDTAERLEAHRFQGETDEELLFRILYTAAGEQKQ